MYHRGHLNRNQTSKLSTVLSRGWRLFQLEAFPLVFVALALLCVHFKWKLLSCAVQHSAYQNETIPTVFFCPSNKIFSHYFK